MNISKTIKRCLFLLGLFLLTPAVHVVGQPAGRDAILIVSSYNPDTRRMANFITDFESQVVKSGVPCDIYVETLECRGVTEAPVWISQTHAVIRRYTETKSLRAIVLLGQEAWSSFISLGNIPKDVLVFGCFVSSNGIMLPPPESTDGLWLPESVDYHQMSDSLNNVGGLLNKYNIKKNIELIQSLYPEVRNIALISDNTYGGISLQALVRKEMASFPKLNLVLVDSRLGDSLVHATYADLPLQSAVLLGTWRVGSDGEYLMQRSLNDLVQTNPQIPVFSLTRTGLGDVAIGGYVPCYESGAGEIATQIKEFYKSGSVEKAHFQITKDEYFFDSKKLKDWKIAEYALPKGSVVEDTMAVKLSKYSYYIDLLALAIGLLLVLLCFVGWLFLHTRKLTHTLEARERELVDARKRAEESDMLKSAFLANMSHEIRTPLNAIVGFTSLVQSEELSSEERSEYCSIVVNNSEMLLTLLNDVLDISSLECGKIKFCYSQEDAVQLCQHVILTTAHTRQPGVECRLECTEKSYTLTTDGHRLSQILINLLTNAGKFTSTGCITLGMEVHPDQGAVLFSVTDTGPGIPLDKQEQVFNRFEKLDGNKKKGTGLGLAICRQIAMIFGGEIWIDPAYTDGARFIFLHPTTPRNLQGEHREGGGGGF